MKGVIMKKTHLIQALAIAFCIMLSTGVHAEMKGHSGHDHAAVGQSHDMNMKAPAGHQMKHSGHMGEMIRMTTVDGHELMYHLIDMQANMQVMKHMKATHHLMVFIKSPHGHGVENAKVGYLVSGPGGSVQKVMTMVMSGGYGADVDLKEKGRYTIKTKVAIGGKKLMDSFEYHVK
jgi:hypothetical protein